MFERFTGQARQVVGVAQDEARTLKQKHIGTEHLLLGLLREGSVAGIARPLGLTYEEVRGPLDEGDEAPTGQMPFTPNAKKALELSLREALNLSDNLIAPAHILLGLLRADPKLFAELGVDEGDVRHLAQLKRFTQRGQRVLELAEQEARALRHNYVGTEHILLAVMQEGGAVTEALSGVGVTAERTEELIMQAIDEIKRRLNG